MNGRLEDYFTRRYGYICDELQFCLDSHNLVDGDLDDMVNSVEWNFACEWDCDLDTWHTDILGGEIVL